MEVFLWVPAVSKVFFQLRIQTIFHEFSDGILEQFLNVVHAADICKLQQFTDFLSPGFFFRASILFRDISFPSILMLLFYTSPEVYTIIGLVSGNIVYGVL